MARVLQRPSQFLSRSSILHHFTLFLAPLFNAFSFAFESRGSIGHRRGGRRGSVVGLSPPECLVALSGLSAAQAQINTLGHS